MQLLEYGRESVATYYIAGVWPWESRQSWPQDLGPRITIVTTVAGERPQEYGVGVTAVAVPPGAQPLAYNEEQEGRMCSPLRGGRQPPPPKLYYVIRQYSELKN